MSCSLAFDVLTQLGVEEDISLYKVMRVSPTDPAMIDFVRASGKVLVIEETDAVLEAIIGGGEKVLGRRNGYVPCEGELDL